MNLNKIKDKLNKNNCVLYFYNDLCQPCLTLRPKIIQELKNYKKIELILIDSSQLNISSYFNVYSNPTIIIYFDNKEYHRFSKYISIKEFNEKLNRLYSLYYE